MNKLVESSSGRSRSGWWYLLPIFFNIVGGVIAYFVLRDDDPRKAKNCLWLGIILTAISVGMMVVSLAFFGMTEDNFWPSYRSI